MGLFDNINVEGLVCYEGHKVTDFQTKDLECAMSDYWVRNGRIWFNPQDTPGKLEETSEGELFWTIKQPLRQRSFVGSKLINIYTNCERCMCVKTLTKYPEGHINESYPWCEFQLTFFDSRLHKIEVIKLESYKDVLKSATENGLTITT